MPVIVHDGKMNIVRLAIPLTEFPKLLRAHLDSAIATGEIEKLGANYVTTDFPVVKTEEFVRQVCHWGNYDGVAGKVLQNNELGFVADRFREATRALDDGNPAAAIAAVTEITGLAVSFGSKHLKFLNPDRAVVLDRIISERLGYRRTAADYAEIVAECVTIRDLLNEAGIDRPPEGAWRVSDVEMAIFMGLKEN